MSQQSVISIRPSEQEVGVPAFQPSVVSSPSNIYIQEVQATTADDRRMSFSWRSPAPALVLSPLAFIRFRIAVKCACAKFSREEMIGSIFGEVDGQHAQDGAVATPAVQNSAFRAYKARPLVLLGEGNAVENACESKQINLNGSQWSQLGGDLFNRTIDECFVPNDVMQRRYSTCGGPNRMGDGQIGSGAVMGIPGDFKVHNNNATQTDNVGAVPVDVSTADSSFKLRMQNFFDQIRKAGGAKS